jgi:large subunit ribosomal protein L13e
MVKHNNQVPNIHCKKKYMQSSRGPLKVKLRLDQATRKKARRVRRQARAARVAPAPPEKLRPVVHCPTQKYSAKARLGRGFTLEELRSAGLHPAYAQRVGIAIDWRRRNRSEESLAANAARLEEYKGKLVVLDKKGAGEGLTQHKGTVQPLPKPGKEIEMADLTDELKDFAAYTTMRVARQETKVEGYRVALENRKKKE